MPGQFLVKTYLGEQGLPGDGGQLKKEGMPLKKQKRELGNGKKPQTQDSRPQDLWSNLEKARQASLSLSTSIESLRNHAAAADRVREFEESVEARIRVVEKLGQGAPFVDRIEASVELAVAFKHIGAFEKALRTVQSAKAQLDASAKNLQVLKILLELEASVFECQGDGPVALYTFEQSLKIDGGAGLSTQQMHKHLGLLNMVIENAARAGAPFGVLDSLRSKSDDIVRQLVALGPWTSRLQLPQHFIQGIESSPWLDPMKFSDAVRKATEALLSDSLTLELATEFSKLERSNMLARSSECIAEKGPGKGDWFRFEIAAPWQKGVDVSTPFPCSSYSPIACRTLAKLRAVGLPVLRAGYSALEKYTRLRNHYGVTNGQLKLHLGIMVPGVDCAGLIVGNSLRMWTLGGIMMFDDSYLHSAFNNCDGNRVVFQIVFASPGVLSHD